MAVAAGCAAVVLTYGLIAGLVTSAIVVFTKFYFIPPPQGFTIDDVSSLTGALRQADVAKRVMLAAECLHMHVWGSEHG